MLIENEKVYHSIIIIIINAGNLSFSYVMASKHIKWAPKLLTTCKVI